MRAKLSHLILILAGLGLSACGGVPPAHVALDVQARNNVHSTDIVAPVRQGEVYVFVPQTANVSGGILGALIAAGVDGVRTSNAEESVRSLRDAVVDFNFDELLRQDLKASMSRVQWLNVADVKVIKDVAAASLDSAITDSKAGAVLMVAADYHLSNDGDIFYIALRANLFPNNPALTPPKASDAKTKSDVRNAIYRNTFTFETKAPGATGDRTSNINIWAANHGELLRALTTKGTAKLTELIATDIQEAPSGSPEHGTGEQVLSNGPDGVLTRHADGTLTFAAQ